MGTPLHTSNRRPSDLQVFILVVALVVLVAGLVRGVQALTGDDDTSDGGSPAVDGSGDDGGATTTSTAADAATPTTDTSGTAAPASGTLQGLAYEPLVTELASLTYVTQPAGETNRLFLVQRLGRIFIVANDNLVTDPFLDIRDRVGAFGIEQGLLGLAFHPDYATNGRLFVYYTDLDGNRQLSEFTAASADVNAVEAATEKVLFELPQPARATEDRHYGGMVMFGPDGYLYVSLGDGANASDQGQNPNTLYGTIVRIDVDGGDPYAIPPGNAFISGGGAAEVWVYGVRNPWRFTIDPVYNALIVADVGLEREEEVDVLDLATSAGANLGWANVEGTRCFQENPCDISDYHVPVLTYGHDDGGCSITGGHVYRGSAIPELTGHYLYSDWCAGWVRSFTLENGAVADEQDWTDALGAQAGINAFGVDSDGELYVVTNSGTLARIVPVR